MSIRLRTICLLIIFFILCSPAIVSGHGSPTKSTPQPDSELKKSPEEVRITLSENVDPELSNITLESEEGNSIQGVFSVEGDNTLVFRFSKLEDGIYKVKWQVLSVDTHVTDGSFRFAVGVPLVKEEHGGTVSLDEPSPIPTVPEKPRSEPSPPQEATTKPAGTAASASPEPTPSSTPALQPNPDNRASSPPIANSQEPPPSVQPSHEQNSDTDHGLVTYEESQEPQSASNVAAPSHSTEMANRASNEDWLSYIQPIIRIVDVLTAISLAGFIFFRYVVWGMQRGEPPALFSIHKERLLEVAAIVIFICSGIFHVWIVADQLSGLGSDTIGERMQAIISTTVLGRMSWLHPAIAGLLLTLSFIPKQFHWAVFSVKLAAIVSLCNTFPLTGHANAAGQGAPYVIVLHTFHMLAVAVWFGGLIGLLSATLVSKGSKKRLREMDSLICRFSAFALPLILFVAISGVILSVMQLHAWSELFYSRYGLLILIKSILLLGVAAIGVFHRLVFIPRISIEVQHKAKAEHTAMKAFIVGVRLEIILAFILFVLAGMLSTTSPP